MKTILLSTIATLVVIAAPAFAQSPAPAAPTPAKEAGVTRVPVVFSEGYDTDPRDHGRPIVLIASALGVSSDVFREAFSGVRPAEPGSGGPTQEEARKNKGALMSVLAKHGITNDRLDAVSNRYRYQRSRGELWTHKDAEAVALVKDGVVIMYEIKNAGYGYSSAPTVTVPNIKGTSAKVELAFTRDFETNGSITAIKPAAR